MAKRARTDHHGYIDAVRAALEALGIETGQFVNFIPAPAVPGTTAREAKRCGGIGIGLTAYWEEDRFEDSISLELEWDEEVGWVWHDTSEPGAGRGTWHDVRGLGLDLVAEPAEVARRVERMLGPGGPVGCGAPRVLRRAADPDPALEAALAAHLPR